MKPEIVKRITKRWAAAILFTLLLIPSASIAWRNREMPQLGRTHDDAIHYIAAKSLAEGHGYRIQNMPGAPYETKYPPVLPWLLAAIYRIYPVFPANLVAMSALEWAFIPLFLGTCLLWFRRIGLTAVQQWVALGLLAVSPYTLAMGAGIHTEALFTVFLLASVMVCARILRGPEEQLRLDQREQLPLALLAGALAGLAYLTRTAGLMALASGPLSLLLFKRRRAALAFAAGMLPFIAGWMLWAHLRKTASTDLVWIYNTDYLAYQFLNVHTWKDLSLVAWKNLGYIPDSMGALLFPMELGSLFYQMFRTMLAVGIVAGLARHFKNRELLPYLLFAAFTLAELLIWHYPPNLRFMYPLIPLFAAGAIFEGSHVLGVLRAALLHRDRSQRVAAWGMAAAAAAFCAGSIFMQGFLDVDQLPEMIRGDEQVRRENLRVYDWISRHTPAGALVVANNPTLYLYTGRQNVPMVVPTIYWYREDQAGMLSAFRDLSSFTLKHETQFVFLSDSDYQAITDSELAPRARSAVAENSLLRPVFGDGSGAVFERQLSPPTELPSSLAARR